MIPRIIHQLWINPNLEESGGITPEVERQSIKWRSLCPTYLYRLWSLEEVLAIADDDRVIGDRARAVIQSLRFPAAQADVARLILLRTFGGFWVDLKLSPCSAFLPSLLDFDLVLTEHFPQSHRLQPNGLLINSFIGSDRNTEFIERVLQKVLLNVEKRVIGAIFDITGPTNLLVIKEEMAEILGALGKYTLLSHTETWDKMFSLENVSYNHKGMHWSVRQRHEPIYHDLKALQAESAQLKAELRQTRQRLAATEKKVSGIVRSRSWRLTEPLRKLATLTHELEQRWPSLPRKRT